MPQLMKRQSQNMHDEIKIQNSYKNGYLNC